MAHVMLYLAYFNIFFTVLRLFNSILIYIKLTQFPLKYKLNSNNRSCCFSSGKIFTKIFLHYVMYAIVAILYLHRVDTYQN